MKKLCKPLMLIIYGPTGVGKTELSLAIAKSIPAEIINIDVGQMYTPLSIGTAKPDWKASAIPHHLFDILNEPINYTVVQYRTVLYKTVQDVLARGKLPIIVGGSAFYIHSLLFPSQVEIEDVDISALYPEDTDWWQTLHSIDPVRAAAIDKADIYRIKRALGIWRSTGKLPSTFLPVYSPLMDYILVYVERDREELKLRIDERIAHMLNHDWIEEATKLMNTPWQPFIEKKNLIGYHEIFTYASHKKTKQAYDDMVQDIADQTKQYAKRQSTFWRKLEREIKSKNSYTSTSVGCLETMDLTYTPIDVYSEQLVQRLSLPEVKK